MEVSFPFFNPPQAPVDIEFYFTVPPSPLKRKNSLSDMEYEDTETQEEVDDVVCKIKRIKFPIVIQVETLTGKILTLDADLNGTVQQLKLHLEELEGIPPWHQVILFHGKKITDNQQTLSSCGIHNGCKLNLVLQLPHRLGVTGIAREHTKTV